jgi:predicted GTPase
MVLLEYEKDSKTIQRPLSLIKSVDVNKSYESYLNNDLNLDKNLFKIPIKMKNSYRK